MSRIVIDAPDMGPLELNTWLSLRMRGSDRDLKNHIKVVDVDGERTPVFTVEPRCTVVQFRRTYTEPLPAA